MVATNSLDIKVSNFGPTKDTSYFFEAIQYFFRDIEVVDGRLDYIEVIGWANY